MLVNKINLWPTPTNWSLALWDMPARTHSNRLSGWDILLNSVSNDKGCTWSSRVNPNKRSKAAPPMHNMLPFTHLSTPCDHWNNSVLQLQSTKKVPWQPPLTRQQQLFLRHWLQSKLWSDHRCRNAVMLANLVTMPVHEPPRCFDESCSFSHRPNRALACLGASLNNYCISHW